MNKGIEATPIQGEGQENLLVLLEDVQRKFGYLSGECLTEVAESLGLSVSDVYGVATFYSFLSTKPRGRNVIRICKSLPCFMENNHPIIETVEREIGIKPGETTPDGMFTLKKVECLGSCDTAPVVQINDDYHEGLTIEGIDKIVDALTEQK